MSKRPPSTSHDDIPQASPKAAYLAHKTEIEAALLRAAESGWYILGREVEDFEREFARYIGDVSAASVGNGTDAIELALRACDVSRGDVVFTVSHTAVATVSAIDRIGAVPVLVDTDPATFTMDPEALAVAIAEVKRSPEFAGARAKAVVPVHLYGHAAAMSEIVELAHRSGLRVVEDCAQAHGGSLDGRRLGTWGDIAAFSFYPTKNLAALGDGGIVVGPDEKMIRRVRAMRQYGWEDRYISATRGFNSRLDVLQAAVLRVRLAKLDAENARRRAIAQRYDEALADTAVQRPVVAAGVHHVYHQYVVRTAGRDELKRHLEREHVGTAVHYPEPIHLQPAYRGSIAVAGQLANTERAAREILSLPIYPQLTDEQVGRIAAAVRAWKGARRPAVGARA